MCQSSQPRWKVQQHRLLLGMHLDTSETMAFVRLLYFTAATYINDKFKQLAPLANPNPDVIPALLIQSFIESSCNAAILVQLLQHNKLINQVYTYLLNFVQILISTLSSFIINPIFLHSSSTVCVLQNIESVIRLAHIERGMAEPTKSTSLHLVCRGIHCQQGYNQKLEYP